MRRALVVAGLALAACGPVPSTSSAGAVVDFADALPANAPSRFEFGAEASEARIALWDVDVKPDGEGLPLGSGTVAEGERIFQMHCIACHGPTGTEGPNDQLVGSEPWGEWPGSVTVGGYWPYATTLYDYITRAMPQLTPGILTADQKYAVIAFILNRNGIVPEDAVMNAETLPAVSMPARDRFVVDDRQGGAQVR
ncbi:MAG: cytochrome c [Gemmatimonadetes bacterium]|nr:cytochrome c [Gemmatimonadota bacterium]